ncbi:unnamed protein product [Phyllotreta striolata]|uniref:RB1-inducible coiled-coil protein 1 n=1 Tax=Phyllotreta striolata TaxID=444603 RepID=A0A9P0DJW0_PHYSR|nr:unnamed protein product [Phyllotreta striolata]
MLHVFHVDSGRMMTFDMSLALESVDNLKKHVQEEFKIAADKQVLLISGGECLDPNKRVCSFSAGTDTNPIFLFSKSIIESPNPPLPIADYGSESDIDLKVKEHCDMPVTFGTLAKRAQLAQHLLELSRKQLSVCENLVHDQHLQQQGWSAVVANLEDISLEFSKRSEIFEKSFTDYMEERETYMTFLNHFSSDLQILQKIPVLPALLETKPLAIEECKPTELEEDEEECITSPTTSTGKDITLYEWISAADNKSTMDQLYDHCSRGLDQFNSEIFRTLSRDIQEMLQNADNVQMKEVKGLGERLFGLEELMREARKKVKQQAELAQSFANNQSRASNTKDPSVLPDLCMSHKQQLQMMAANHQQLCDIRRRCAKAKEELSINLYHRLKWVMYVEDRIQEIDQKLVIYHENLKRLRRHLEILQQIHLAPATYLCAVAEVVRRRAFSQSFLLWASELACHLLTIHNDEVTRRKEFQIQFEGHFLNSLFPGMNDMPPSFATQAPAMFDVILPKITLEDINRLKVELPDLADNLNIPDTSSIENFFLLRSLTRKDDEEIRDKPEETKAVEDKLIQAVSNVGLASDLDRDLLRGTGNEPCLTTAHGLVHLKDFDKGCESETDTEEFEKVSQSPLEMNFDKNITTLQPRMQDASTFTEVSEKLNVPPKKPVRIFYRSQDYQHASLQYQRTLSICSNTESITNHKNHHSSDEFSNSKSTDNCHISHEKTLYGTNLLTAKSVSPHTPQSSRNSPNSPCLGHQMSNVSGASASGGSDFANDEFFIDESLPSSLSIETGHSQCSEFNKQLDTAHNVVALLQDNLQITRSEYDKLKSCLVKLHELAQEAMVQLRLEMSDLRAQVESNRNDLALNLKEFCSSWNNLIVMRDNEEKATIREINGNFEGIIKDLEEQKRAKDQKIEELLMEKSTLEGEILKSCESLNELQENFNKTTEENSKTIDDLRKRLEEKEIEKEKSVKEASDNLRKTHKAELENIRARFKLMTMERSPSDNSLEKSSDFSSLPNHSIFIQQMAENFELDKERAVNEAIAGERQKWEKLLSIRIKELENKFGEEKDALMTNLAKQITEEKDKQIDILMQREKNLNLECIKYKNTIQQLTENETEYSETELLKKIATLQEEKGTLEDELVKIKREKSIDLTTSLAVCDGKVDAAGSSPKQKDSSKGDCSKGKISIDSCKPGDLVLVMWDEQHENFKILQENKHMFFLHSEYMAGLGLEITTGRPNRMFCLGEVLDKEYCYARKSENRYKVPKRTKFFRVKVKGLNPPLLARDSISSQSFYQAKASSDGARMTQSQSGVSSTGKESMGEEKSGPQSLPSSPTRPAPPERSELEPLEEKESEDSADGTRERRAGQWSEKHFAEDSGIVDIVESVSAAADDTLTSDSHSRNESESSDR